MTREEPLGRLVACDSASSLVHPLVLLLTYDEELGTLGARHLVEARPLLEPFPRGAVIGEPTSLGVVRMHKGHLKFRIVLRGRAGHSAYPASGKNAIEMAGRAIHALTELGRGSRRKRHWRARRSGRCDTRPSSAGRGS